MATKLLEKSQEMGIETPSLKLITEMSFAYKRQDYSWFNDNYYKIWERYWLFMQLATLSWFILFFMRASMNREIFQVCELIFNDFKKGL